MRQFKIITLNTLPKELLEPLTPTVGNLLRGYPVHPRDLEVLINLVAEYLDTINLEVIQFMEFPKHQGFGFLVRNKEPKARVR